MLERGKIGNLYFVNVIEKTAAAASPKTAKPGKASPQENTSRKKRQAPFTGSLPDTIRIERQILVFASYDDFSLKFKTALRVHIYSDDKQEQKYEGEYDTDCV